MIEILEDLGLSQNEAKVYLALLKYGTMNLRDLTRTSGLYRPNAYEALDRLGKKGLVGIGFAGKRKVYNAVDPSRLKSLLEERNKRLELLLPELLQMGESKEKPHIDILYGREGLKTILDDEIAVGKTMHVLQSSETVETRVGSYLEISRARRAAAKIKMKILYGKKDADWARKAAEFPHTEARMGEEQWGVTIDVYGDRTVIVFGNEPTIVRIMDKETARRFLSFFEINWKKGKPIK